MTSSSASGPSSAAKWILVVDDDKTMLGLFELVLKSQGWPVEIASSAREAVSKIESAATAPSVLVCDVIMDGMDGLELTRRLLSSVPGLKAIVVSAHLNEMSYWPEDLKSCPFIAKPFHQEELVSAVRKALAD